MSPIESLGIAFILLACAIPAVAFFLVIYFAIRLRHKQIMAAIEKGTPLSELRSLKRNGPRWIMNITLGIMAIGLGLALVFAGPDKSDSPGLFLAITSLGVGLALIIRGMLYRRYGIYGGQIQSPQNQERGMIQDERQRTV
jgi:uncharacterized membrane protein HdeD (DUF308 family)